MDVYVNMYMYIYSYTLQSVFKVTYKIVMMTIFLLLLIGVVTPVEIGWEFWDMVVELGHLAVEWWIWEGLQATFLIQCTGREDLTVVGPQLI